MSRLGKKPLPIPEKVTIQFKDQVLEVSGPLGKLVKNIDPRVRMRIDKEKNQVFVEVTGTSREDNMMHGLMRGELKNWLEGVVTGFKKNLEIHGLGYKANVEGKKLNLVVGYSHPVNFDIPEGVKVVVDKNTLVTVSGLDKMLVGETAARIRSVKKPEPYQLTGIRYAGEHIIKKAGKAAAGGAAGAVKK